MHHYMQTVQAYYRHLQEQREVEAHEEHLQTFGVVDAHFACYKCHVELKVADMQPWVKTMALMMQLTANVVMAVRAEVALKAEKINGEVVQRVLKERGVAVTEVSEAVREGMITEVAVEKKMEVAGEVMKAKVECQEENPEAKAEKNPQMEAIQRDFLKLLPALSQNQAD